MTKEKGNEVQIPDAQREKQKMIVMRQGTYTTRTKQKKYWRLRWTTPRSGKGDHDFAQPHGLSET
jgi:hypothetical protein